MFNQGIHFSSGADSMSNYEEGFIATMAARGLAVVVTDYEGLGTPGVPTFLNRLSEGQVLIDAAWAAMQLPNTSLTTHGRSRSGDGPKVAVRRRQLLNSRPHTPPT
jgi:Secretory lipase